MKKWMIIVVMLLLSGCASRNKVQDTVNIDKKIGDSVKYESETLDVISYNQYVQAYNQITEVVAQAVSEYQKACGLGDTPLYTTYQMADVIGGGKGEALDATLQKPLLTNELGNPFSKEYKTLQDTIKPFLEIYEKTRIYYDRPNQDVTESEYLHKQFIICYVQFKNAYYDFSKSLMDDYDQSKYEEMLHLKEMHLDIHSQMYKSILISKDIVKYLKAQQRAKEKTKDVQEMLDVSFKELAQMTTQLEQNDVSAVTTYGFSVEKNNQLEEFVVVLKAISALGTESAGDIQRISGIESKVNDLARIYNQLLK